MIVFRHADPRLPFLWEDRVQPPARWHDTGEGPAHYLCDTPDGAWAEFLRYEDIRNPEDLATIRRAIWAIEIDDDEQAAVPEAVPDLPRATLIGGPASHVACRAAARALRARGFTRLDVPSAALEPGGAHGHRVDAGLKLGPPRDARIIVLYGRRPSLVGWRAAHEGRPSADLLGRVRYL